MKTISSLLMATGLMFVAATSFAAATSMSSNWTCTTNASSSDVEADKVADKDMSESVKSAEDAFSFAAKNCRDCTKITCEAKS